MRCQEAAPQDSGSKKIPGSRVTQLHPPPPPRARATRRPPASVFPPFHFRVCVGVCPGGREGARARGATRGRAALRERRGKGSWRAAPRSASSADPAPYAIQPLSELAGQWRPPQLTPPPTRPPREDTPPFLGVPPHDGGGAEARRAPEREERSSLPGWAAREQEKKLFPPAPSAWSRVRAVPRRWELHLRPGREGRAGLWGAIGEGCGVTSIGVRFLSASSLPVAGVGGRPLAPPTRFPPAGGWTLCYLLWLVRV